MFSGRFFKIMKYFILFTLLLAVQTDSFAQYPCDDPATSNCADKLNGSFLNMSTSNNIDFVFDEMRDYVTGITLCGKTQLQLNVEEIIPLNCKWRLRMFVDIGLHMPDDEWEPLVMYGAGTDIPPLNLIQVKVFNGCGTPLFNGAFQSFIGNQNWDILEIIPNSDPRVDSGPCDGSPVNGPGSYLTDYNEYSFTIDYRIDPKFQYSSGAYQIIIRFCLVEF